MSHAFVYDISGPRKTPKVNFKKPIPKAATQNNSPKEEYAPPATARETLATPVSCRSNAPSMIMGSHKKSIYRKDYNRKQSVPNAIYNPNLRQFKNSIHPIDGITINKVLWFSSTNITTKEEWTPRDTKKLPKM